jgi:hypothetical protein
VGKLSEAVEWLERARGELYAFHQMLGHLDFQMSEAADMLRAAGHPHQADVIDERVVGRNVLDGRWTFQIVEEFEDLYYREIRDAERSIRDDLMAGRRPVFEAELKEKRRTRGAAGHESRPPAAHDGRVSTEPATPNRSA